ncbi:MAG TPA: exopolysaccharide biosynthesis polyprenyl glycosylphosphotransferase [Pilimelia sp.]|nr:exopolysaccharide biosynthesis polyprenyl glycosylphosphotransferase [Pilimelia sp.]
MRRFGDVEPDTADLSTYYNPDDDDTLLIAAIQDDFERLAVPTSPAPAGLASVRPVWRTPTADPPSPRHPVRPVWQPAVRSPLRRPDQTPAPGALPPAVWVPVVPGTRPAPPGTSPAAPETSPPAAPKRRFEGPVPAGTRPERLRYALRSIGWPFGRVPGRHAAQPRRGGWQASYVRALVAADVLVGLAAGALAFALRFQKVTAYNRFYLVLSLLLPLVLVGVLAMNRAYEKRFLFVGTDEYQRVIRAGLALTASAAIVSYAFEIQLARSYVLIALPAAMLTTVLVRFGIRKRLHRARAKGGCLRRVIVVGHELAVIHITRQLRRERFHGLEVVGACLPPHHDGQVGLPVYGTFDAVAEAVEAAAADTVIVLSCPELDGHVLRRLAWRLERDDIDLIVASALIDVAGDRTTIRPVDGLPMLHVEHPRLEGGARIVKEIVDRVGAMALILMLSPVLLTLALWIRLGSRGPVLFRQVRVGRDGGQFPIYKFRSMYVDAEQRLAEIKHLNEHDGVLFKMRNDPRVTPAGRWLRRLSLDELPQLFNVLKGDMSLVGPRPPLPEEVAVYPDDVRRRLAVKPGMTGLWQVSGRSDLPWEEAVRLDLRYVENWSLTLDFVILLRTVTAVARSSGAY